MLSIFKKRYVRIAWLSTGIYILMMIFFFLTSNAITVTRGEDEKWLYFIFIVMFYISPVVLFYTLLASTVAVVIEFNKRREELNSIYRDQDHPVEIVKEEVNSSSNTQK